MAIKDLFKSSPSHSKLHDSDDDAFLEEIEELQQQPVPDQSSEAIPASTRNEMSLKGPIGLDIGTANIVIAQNRGNDIRALRQLNAFFTIPYANITKDALSRDNVLFLEKDDKFYILGHAAEHFANTFGGNTRRPIESGLLNPKEHEAINVIKALINKLVPLPDRRGKKICFSVPGDPIDRPGSVVFHESVFKMHLQSLGYAPISVNEGLAVVLSELSKNNFTGIGISMGGGMCNVCFSYLSVPVLTYSIQKGGDYIDSMVGNSVGEPPTKIKAVKEEGLNLSVSPRNRIEIGLHIYYEDLFSTLIQSLRRALGSSDNIPRLTKAVPIVLSGGTVLPQGSREKFKKAMSGIRLPVKISDIVLAKTPLYATAKGALRMAMTENSEI